MQGEIERLVQIGTVSAVDMDTHKVRVLFPNTGLVSDWLCVLRNTPQVSISGAAVDGAGTHAHGATVSPWLPKVNDTVLVLYLPIFNSDGFVIGGI